MGRRSPHYGITRPVVLSSTCSNARYVSGSSASVATDKLEEASKLKQQKAVGSDWLAHPDESSKRSRPNAGSNTHLQPFCAITAITAITATLDPAVRQSSLHHPFRLSSGGTGGLSCRPRRSLRRPLLVHDHGSEFPIHFRSSQLYSYLSSVAGALCPKVGCRHHRLHLFPLSCTRYRPSR